ncbi:adenine phosphoribosyltransferase [Patescibacteria group bacterium]|nr:adenine phosphoribosyltransferase [Patescibacteria group bacterium]
MDIRSHIREVPDWPTPGVSFKDITTLLEDPKIFREVIDKLTQPFESKKIDKVVAIDARGFLLATPIAYKIGSGVCLVRKKGKLPYKTIEESYQKEYGPDTLTMHEDTVKSGERVLIVDDVLATGGTMAATIRMVERLGGKVVGMSFIVNLPFLGGEQKLSQYPIHYLVAYNHE